MINMRRILCAPSPGSPQTKSCFCVMAALVVLVLAEKWKTNRNPSMLLSIISSLASTALSTVNYLASLLASSLSGFMPPAQIEVGYVLRLVVWFLVWTLAEYSMHRLMHVNHPYNILFPIHRYHHKIPYETIINPSSRLPKWTYFFFWFENWHETLEIVLGETVPALLICYLDPRCGGPIFLFHYVYELFATDSLLEHNPSIENPHIVTYLAVGQFHLEHHRSSLHNFGFTITLWDHLFGTYAAPTHRLVKSS
eukprot:TRINITY_DN1981_c0_g3_i2.p1 TRINITY_DN1981_c0_g3~~TRINITY_DN1981_c0_g3_i2.p1  ORF type:complete len:253 (+),score=27.46 TRINITY_DN1981_c0_g3_i2:106-864(+)